MEFEARGCGRLVGTLALVVVLVASCNSSGEGLPDVEPSDDETGQGGMGAPVDGATDDPVDAGRPDLMECDPPEELKDLGVTCGCNEECASGSCVDGVCCSGACDGVCMACNVPGKMGACSPVPEGQVPVVAGQCEKQEASTCGFDGTCDGNGACREYPDGTVCQKGTCDGATVKDVKVCVAGACEEGPNEVCAPFGCDGTTGTCFGGCFGNAECAPGQTCELGSCGKKKLGARCEMDGECESSSCTDGVCCNTACEGACVSCNQVGKMGECTPVKQDLPDPHGICQNQAASTCGTSGVCDGQGACARYAAGTTCRAARCEGGSLIPASTCDGGGSCKMGSPVNCAPFACVGNACKATCQSNADCVGGNTCINGSCGKKGLGQSCSANNQCQSNFCVDGVCCNSACGGLCQFCASADSLGRCVNVAPGRPDPRAAAGERDPRKACLDEGPGSCGRNGMCNGNAGCQVYAQGTQCAGERCNNTTNTYSAPSRCDGAGTCVAGAARTCAPYVCNGNRCGNSCGGNNDCAPPNTCDNSMASCGKKALAALCSSDTECQSGNCEQGVCCSSKCEGSCFSCALPSSAGTCTAVPAGGMDPAKVCQDQGAASCGFDGTCNGSGACRRYAQGTICQGASCSNGVEKRNSTCNGTGTCVAGEQRSCDPFVCNNEGTACFASCTSEEQCAGDNQCQTGGSCGKKAEGATCSLPSECRSGHCVDGYCCNNACEGVCRTCAANGFQGTCLNIPNGVADPDGGCAASSPSACGLDGFCNGGGACRQWNAQTICRFAFCDGGTSTLVNEAKCDGQGSCPAVATTSCGVYMCDPATEGACLKGCDDNADCAGGNICIDTSCGLKKKGETCDLDLECEGGLHCVDGVCCTSTVAACGVCSACNVGGSEGDCTAISGASSECAVTPETMMLPICQRPTGSCSNGACALTAAGTGCGTICVDGGTASQAQICDGSGTCQNQVDGKMACGQYKCDGTTGTCLDACSSDADCATGYGCQKTMGSETGLCKRKDGAVCSAAGDCKSGSCVDGTCCASASCPACQSCANSDGTCKVVGDGIEDDGCMANLCFTGVCMAGGCVEKTCSAVCGGDMNTAVQAQACDPADGTCKAQGAATDCGSYFCNPATNACFSNCSVAEDCRNGTVCDLGVTNQCQLPAPPPE